MYRYAATRQQEILRVLHATGQIDAASLAAEFGVTAETVRKDLIALERQGLLRRVHGGALPVEALTFEPEVSARTEFTEEKTRIARAALAHLDRAGSVFLDAGSTTSRLAEILPTDRPLTIFTNTLSIALTLVAKPNLTVFTLGGRVRGRTLAEVDTWAARALQEINVDVAFLGTNGISLTRGLTTPDPAEAAIKRLMLSCAVRRVLLADHSKVGRTSLCQHGTLADIDALITDTGLADTDLDALRAAGSAVELA
ncbi:DeoR/GlpR family DNA-binding transcription regulator [Pseudonocardia spinosispora]|uniref:DeoR/GlpR family DNA-binding transcription regulator n=1 Tax=Pseudonocardia spinosispora TaxID=103441 RepID=UPI0003F8BAD5|nr:DeoR/GlpR family DNA-binding transcription regulator [Pseudonocardia spinosispora]